MSNALVQNKPNKRALITNILNRVDGKSLAITKNKKGPGITYYLESENQKHLKADKESLVILSYEELEIILSGENLTRESFTMAMFNLKEHVPAPKVVPRSPSVHVRNYKEVDKQGSGKFSDPKEKDAKSPGVMKKKPQRKRI